MMRPRNWPHGGGHMKLRLIALLLCAGAVSLAAVTWPIKTSSNGRYFVDSAGNPFFMNFDTVHHIVALIPPSGFQAYMDSRKSHGFNGVNVFGSCSTGNCPSSGG